MPADSAHDVLLFDCLTGRWWLNAEANSVLLLEVTCNVKEVLMVYDCNLGARQD
jgi:hypothetical protein